jgi:hypothetical protein
MLDGFQARVYDRHRDHPDAMLHTWWQCCNLGEDALIRWSCHDLMGVPFGTAIWSDDCNAWAEILDKVPTSACDCEQIHIVVDVAKDLQCRVVLKEQIHLYAESSNVLEHVGELHVLGIRAKAIEASHCQLSQSRPLGLDLHVVVVK